MDSDSFLSFFSTTAQVLATLTGLFAVLIMYLIQKNRSAMLSYTQIMIGILKTEFQSDKKLRPVIENEPLTVGLIIKKFEHGILTDDLFHISLYMNSLQGIRNKNLKDVLYAYEMHRKILEKRSSTVVNMTVQSIITIGFCLLTILFKDSIMDIQNLKIAVISLVTVLIFASCRQYAILFKRSFLNLEVQIPNSGLYNTYLNAKREFNKMKQEKKQYNELVRQSQLKVFQKETNEPSEPVDWYEDDSVCK